MASKHLYIVAENWGKGFYDMQDAAKFQIKTYPGDVIKVPSHNRDVNLWINKVLGTVKTKEEAQAIVDAKILEKQNAWDALSDEDKNIIGNERPASITLE